MKEDVPRFNCVVVDDEEHGIRNLERCIALLPGLELSSVYTDPVVALHAISTSSRTIDFLFLDIDMPELSGLDLALAVRDRVDKLVFVTAHSKYSLKAYEVLCNQYLLKPFTQEQFISAMKKLMVRPMTLKEEPLEFIFVKSGPSGKYMKVSCADIVSISSLEHYVVIHTLDKKYVQHVPLREVELSLCANPDFIRIHKSHIVSKRHILGIHANAVVMSNGEQIAIGSTYKLAFGAFIGTNTLGRF